MQRMAKGAVDVLCHDGGGTAIFGQEGLLAEVLPNRQLAELSKFTSQQVQYQYRGMSKRTPPSLLQGSAPQEAGILAAGATHLLARLRVRLRVRLVDNHLSLPSRKRSKQICVTPG
jgi:hypothetical protein